jgi:hypothetical protein
MEESDMNDNEYSNEMKNIVEFEKTANDMKKEVKRLYLNSGFTQVLILLTIITFLLTLFYFVVGYIQNDIQAILNEGRNSLLCLFLCVFLTIIYYVMLVKVNLTKFMRGNINGVRKYTLAFHDNLYTLTDLTVGNIINFSVNDIMNVRKQ